MIHNAIDYVSPFQISLNIASLLIITLLYYVIKNRVNINTDYYYKYFRLLVGGFLASIFGCLDQFLLLEYFDLFVSLKYIVHILYVLSLLILTILFTRYFLALIGIEDNHDKKWDMIVYAPGVAISIVTITTFMHKGIFYYHINGTIGYGRIYNLLYIVIGLYICMWLYISKKYKKNLTQNRSLFILSFSALFVLATIAFKMIGFIGIFNFLFSVSLIIIINTVQKPIDLFDKSGALRRGLLFYDIEKDLNRNTNFSIIFIRLTDYQLLIDSYGELETQIISKVIVDYLSEVDRNGVLYRLDNQTFALMLPDDNEQRITFIAREILRRFTTEFHVDNIRLKIPAGIVILRSPFDVTNIEEFKNMIAMISSSKIEQDTLSGIKAISTNDRETIVINAVKRALAKKSFQVYYQPIYSTKKKKIIAAEALIRLIDDKLGFVSPEEFIPLAEREGYIIKIGKYVFTEVCKFIKSNNLSKIGIEYVEVNLSALQCTHANLVDEFMDIMKEYDVTPSQINFEITESSILTNNTTVSTNIDSFINEGSAFSLDDYGTGYSSITYLASIPFSIIKIDKSTLWAADNNEKANYTLENIISMARELDMRVVVEGVETEDHVKKLLEYGCDYFQGYYFSKPVKGVDFMKYMHDFKVPEICEKSPA